jgi:large conductance mechanosensitive channel
MSIMKDFKAFAMRGNVVDLAVGVIIGAAFGKIVDSVVNDLVMPLIGSFADSDFSNVYLPLSSSAKAAVAAHPHLSLADAKKAGAVFAWGNFLTVTLNFIILAFIIFMMVRLISRLQETTPPPPPPAKAEPTPTEKLLMEIRDELKERS